MPSTQAVPATNRLLAALSSKDRQHLLASCEPVKLMLAEMFSATPAMWKGYIKVFNYAVR